MPGARNVYQRFDKYKPRDDGTPDWTAGSKVVHFDRVEWTTIPDSGTKSAALQAGEQDWWENPTHDLLPLLRTDKNIKISVSNSTGAVNMMRPNHLQPPFNNPTILRALFYAIDQPSFMEAIVGSDASMYHTPHGFFCPNTPMASSVGLDPLLGPRDFDKVKQMLKQAGYADEKVVMLVATDYPQFKAIGDVAGDMMTQAGMNVDYIATDEDHMNPSNHYAIRGNGNDSSAWPGWCVSSRLEDLRNAWFNAPDAEAQRMICQDIQLQCMVDVLSLPLGQYIQPTAYRSHITGILSGFATFWNVRPT